MIFDDRPTLSLAQKVALAAAAFYKKSSIVPNVCYVHASELDGDCEVPGIEVRPGILGSRPVLPHNLWIGREEQKEERNADA